MQKLSKVNIYTVPHPRGERIAWCVDAGNYQKIVAYGIKSAPGTFRFFWIHPEYRG